MKKSEIIRYLAYVTFILILFSILPGEALAARNLSESGNGNQYAGQNIDSKNITVPENITDPENREKDSSEGSKDPENSSSKTMQQGNQAWMQDRNMISAYQLEKKNIQEDLQAQKKEYRQAKEDFLKIRNQIQTGKLNVNSREAVEATRIYLNSSISYMAAHLKNVKTVMQYSNGNGTEERIAAIDENIKLLEAEQAKVASASSQQELVVIVSSVREIWTDAQKASLIGAGQTVSQRIGEFLDKSGNLSQKLEIEIVSLNEIGVNTSSLEARLTSYNSYIKTAREKKEAADAIYEDDNATLKDLEVGNNYLRESLKNVNKANQILRTIFDELKEYNLEEAGEVEVGNSIKTELNNTISTN